ncbi:hypothetical protein BU23DRAFT_300995 [Bimuria novae-zelandiae CBS 107.79]|uniref:Uncharacterized protein n=1 Tax=Bimuria novae-zelandiae CBS 107.79 TaxID=1447943 RepID=A0A6A5URC4_9PLEO|nr:hypothetical protein BU23DRAFT_300995 [Bimuria novae-zelandiae CBS 107.79]
MQTKTKRRRFKPARTNPPYWITPASCARNTAVPRRRRPHDRAAASGRAPRAERHRAVTRTRRRRGASLCERFCLFCFVPFFRQGWGEICGVGFAGLGGGTRVRQGGRTWGLGALAGGGEFVRDGSE